MANVWPGHVIGPWFVILFEAKMQVCVSVTSHLLWKQNIMVHFGLIYESTEKQVLIAAPGGP